MEWADLPIIDLSKASTPEGRAELAPQVRDAMRTFGFMYVVNHGLTQAQVCIEPGAACDLPSHNGLTPWCGQNERIFDIADVPFSQVAEDEKKQFSYDIKATGLYKGYKLRQYWVRLQYLRLPRLSLTLAWHTDHAQHIDNGVRDQIEHYNSAYCSLRMILRSLNDCVSQ